MRDQRVSSPFRLKALAPWTGGRVDVIVGDMEELAQSIPVEVAYYDPPYNGRQYCSNYHVLENLARWEKPALRGKTRKFDCMGLRSRFSSRSAAAAALRSLMDGTRARHVFLSYSSEGILSRGEILDTLTALGDAHLREFEYPVFGNGAGVSVKRNVTEYLFHLQKRE